MTLVTFSGVGARAGPWLVRLKIVRQHNFVFKGFNKGLVFVSFLTDIVH